MASDIFIVILFCKSEYLPVIGSLIVRYYVISGSLIEG
jgi:hypothetical protein